jgi:hypothetical protein
LAALQALEIGHGFGGAGSGREDGAGIFLHQLKPLREILRMIGAGILQITFNAVNLVGQSLWQNVVAGGVILTAVIVDKLFEKSRTFGGGGGGGLRRAQPPAAAAATTAAAVTEGQS